MCGLRNEHIQRKLLAEVDLTLQKALQTAQGLEAAYKQAEELRRNASQAEEVHAVAGKTTNASATRKTGNVCYRCGRAGHSPEGCFARSQRCYTCGKAGHIARACKQRAERKSDKPPKGDKANLLVSEDQSESDGEEEMLFNIKTVGDKDNAIIVSPEIEGKTINMELDTGASVSIVSEVTWKQNLDAVPLKQANTVLRTYSGEVLTVLGQCQVQVHYCQQKAKLPLLVVQGKGPSLFGRNWLEAIRLNWAQIKRVTSELETLLQKYRHLFEPELGTVKGIEAKLEVRAGTTPKFCRARPVPYALKETIEKDLERLVDMGVIEPVTHSEWATPIVPVPKADGTIRICGDFKVTLNPALIVDQYPLPRLEDLFASLSGGQKFTKIDLSHAYQQLLLDEESRKLVTVTTHRGLYRYNRLPFGVASAPAIFQKLMEQVLQGVPDCICYIDDVLVTGKSDDEHLQHIGEVFERFDKFGLRVKKAKCFFLKPSVEYLGYKVDAEGLHATQSKIDAVANAPTPENVKQLRAFMGLVNYYGRFVPSLATRAQPLYILLRQNVTWKWDQGCEEAFRDLKKQLVSSTVLVHYDPKLPLKMEGDASAFGVGAVLTHVFPDGSERPVAYASRTLLESERNYCQTEKEALSLIF